MKRLLAPMLLLIATAAFVPVASSAATQQDASARVCGRVVASTQLLVALTLAPGENLGIVIARSQSEEVQTTVSPDGSYCFANLHPDLHTITAFGDPAVAQYIASVTPVSGATKVVGSSCRCRVTKPGAPRVLASPAKAGHTPPHAAPQVQLRGIFLVFEATCRNCPKSKPSLAASPPRSSDERSSA